MAIFEICINILFMDDNEWAFYVNRKSQEELSDINNEVKDHFNPAFAMHNKFADQSLYNNLTAQYMNGQGGTQCIYYVTSLSKTKKPVFVGNQTQNVIRSFHVKISGDAVITPEMIKFAKAGISGLDQTRVVIHREVFFKHNVRNLKENGIAPLLDPKKHNPWISQRGYTEFNYEGYSAEQLFPKAGDLIKQEWSDTLYLVESVNTKVNDLTFLQKNYFFSLNISEYHDDHKDVTNDAKLESTNTGDFIQEKFDQEHTLDVGPIVDNGPVTNPDYADTSKFWKDLNTKDDVLYRPPEVVPEEKNISNSKKYGQSPFGKW
jgi:hypothetical protein